MTGENSREVVAVGGKMVDRIEYKGIPVVTFKMVDELHNNKNEDASKRFARNKKQFTEGKDYFPILSGEARNLGITAPNGLNVLTESGYLKLVKTFTDDLAWEIQGQLVECYFHRRHTIITSQPNTPAPSSLDVMQAMVNAMREHESRIITVEQGMQHINNTRRAEPYQYKMIQDAVHAKAKWFLDNHKVPYAKGISKTWTLLKNRFEVPTCQMIVAAKVDDAVCFIQSLKLGHLATI